MFKRFFKKQKLLSIILCIPFLGAAFEHSTAPTQPSTQERSYSLNTLSSLIIERIELAQDLAIYKWNHKLPIDEPENEKAFLLDIADKAKSIGLDSTFVQHFFVAQAEAAKMVSIEHFELWVNQDTHKHDYAPNLIALQKKLSDIDEKLLIALKGQSSFLSDSSKKEFQIALAKELSDKGFSRDVIDSATHF